MSVTSLGGSGGLSTAKMAISKSAIGFVSVLVAWVMVNLFMTVFGFIDPMGDGSWEKISCNLDTTFCGDGIVNGKEVCEPSVSIPLDCETMLGIGFPDYCADIPVDGTRSCNCTCDGWNDCVANSPTPIDSSSTACDATSPQMNDYACCELTDCTPDGCTCCGRPVGAAIPGGYNLRQSLSPCGTGNNSCRLSQSIANPRDWMITTIHTTANFRCWK